MRHYGFSKKKTIQNPVTKSKNEEYDYGPKVFEDCSSDAEMAPLVKESEKKLQVTKDQQHQIKSNTTGQHLIPNYKLGRINRIPATVVRDLCNLKDSTSPDCTMKKALYITKT
ncbi:hypothetical protein ILUMI_03051 [Ignelater luminosus]|uniref:Uncharacterized protein n=1 Tax=Ignelater luminosus TaxID=2038154 RepID=A0A8K0GKA4_IGNLU|nr:hypothetical protein ILUMI_03051 [Ignelater luminosus]